MQTQPLVSIIMPVYNVDKYLPECIQSVLDQTYTNFELLAVDDGSPDKCPEIIENFAKQDKRVISIHQQNGGGGCCKKSWVR